jgi:hypothetical protein
MPGCDNNLRIFMLAQRILKDCVAIYLHTNDDLRIVLLAHKPVLDSSLDHLLANYDIYLLSKHTIANNGLHLDLYAKLLTYQPHKSYLAIPPLVLFANL